MDEKMTPRIRFKGFKDDWERRNLGDVVENQYNGQTPSRNNPDFWGGEIPWLTSGELNHGIVNNTVETITVAGQKDANLKIVPAGTFVMAITGLEAPGTRGNSSILGFDTTVNQSVMALFPNEKLDTQFLFQWYQKVGEEYGISYTQGTKQQSYNAELIKILPFTLPDNVEEQQRIAKLLFKLDDLIASNQKKLDNLQMLKKLLMQKIFDQEWRFKGFTDPWERRKLGEVVNVNSGKDYKHLNKGKIPVYGTGGYMLSVDSFLSEEDGIGIGRKGTINSPYILKAPYWTVDTLFYVIPKKNYNLAFVYSIFQKINWKLYDESTGVPSLSKQTINAIDVTVPIFKEQEKIGSIFQTLDTLIASNQQHLNQLKTLKKYLMQNMFV